MNIELDEVVFLNVSDDALELAAGSAQQVAVLTVGKNGFDCYFVH
jgi:hypothetical protein